MTSFISNNLVVFWCNWEWFAFYVKKQFKWAIGHNQDQIIIAEMLLEWNTYSYE